MTRSCLWWGRLYRRIGRDFAVRAYPHPFVDVKPQPVGISAFGRGDLILTRDKATATRSRARTPFSTGGGHGRMGFMQNNKALCMLSVLINTHLLLAAKDLGIRRSSMPRAPAL